MIWIAVILFIAGSLAIAWAEDRLHRQTDSAALILWGEKLGLPMARSICLIAFIMTAYPALFGLRVAPDLGAVFSAHPGRWSNWVNALFLAGLVLPLLPGLRRLPALVLPVQGCLGVALLFGWVAQELALPEVSTVPAASTAAALVLLALLAFSLAKGLAYTVRDALLRRDLDDLLLLWLQLPILVLYGLHLGTRLR